MITLEELHTIMPGLPAARNAQFLPFLQAAMTEFAIDPAARAAAFLAQLAHESGQFRFMEEIWGPTPAQRRYEPPTTLATQLGNVEEGDGHRFKGRGPIQITGRANYRRFGDLLGLDLIASPEQAASPDTAFRIAGLFWSKKGLNELADQATADAFREITRRINGGFNGLAEREKFYAVARTVLGGAASSVARGAAVRAAAPRAPLPRSAEPQFERGYEAIRAQVPQRRTRKTAPIKRRAPKPKPKPRAKKRTPTRRTKSPAKRSKPRAATRKASKRRR
jgi:predicted chitinase